MGQKNTIGIIVITAIVSSVLTFLGYYTFGIKTAVVEVPLLSECEIPDVMVDGREKNGVPIDASIPQEEINYWEHVTDIAGISFKVPTDYGWRTTRNQKDGSIDTVHVYKDGQQSAPVLSLIKTTELYSADEEKEEIIAIQPITMEIGEGRKITIMYYDVIVERNVVSAYYIFSNNGQTYRLTLYDNSKWELFDDIAKTVRFDGTQNVPMK